MWVSIVPIGGLKLGKTILHFQADLKSQQPWYLFDLKLENIKIGQSIEEINKGAIHLT
jgi:hypothetical protein